jgi:formylglycine-generating enzyme required for sulfatase activity
MNPRSVLTLACLTLFSLPLFPGVALAQTTAPMLRPPFDAPRALALRSEWAKAQGSPEEFANSIGMKLVLIPGGRFDMGVKGSKHAVTLAKGYYLGAHEVTMGQYRKFKPDHQVPEAAAEFQADDMPAAMLSWNDARAFCEWLSERPEEKAAGRRYALPTEAQWEWAARAGTEGPRHFDGPEPDLVKNAWYNHTYTPNPKHESEGRGRHPVGKLRPNAWGLFDLYGNVWEWTAERHVDEATGESRDPAIRGGGWRSGGSHCNSESRDPGPVGLRQDHVGFRVVCRIERP